MRRILIADDKVIDRRVLIGVLTPLGFECSEAVDGEYCLSKAAASRPDLILMDLVMPHLDGLEATRRLRRRSETASIPIVALSASAFEADKAQCLGVGCEAFISQPVASDKLLETLARCLDLEWIYQESAQAVKSPAARAEVTIEHLPEAQAQALWEFARKGTCQGDHRAGAGAGSAGGALPCLRGAATGTGEAVSLR